MSNLPKSEIHVHLEGCFAPRTARKLASRHNITLPEEIFGENETYISNGFLDFLRVFDIVSQVVRTPEDYRDITYDYLMQSAEEGVIYSEVMPSPDHAFNAGMSYENMLEGVVSGIEDAKRDSGIIACIYMSCVRHYGVERCEKVAKMVARDPHPLVRGFGMGGDEAGYSADLFVKTYAIANDAGLGCVAHAGEKAGPDSIELALKNLPISRIGHGVRAIEAPHLLDEIIDREITLEVCPTSNVYLDVYPNYQAHPLLKLRERGVKVCLNSDDPPFFGTTIGNEYKVGAKHFGLDDKSLIEMTKTAIRAGFIDDETKAQLLEQCDAAL